jgi:hypothetical protein
VSSELGSETTVSSLQGSRGGPEDYNGDAEDGEWA